MNMTLLSELETAVQRLLQQNTELKTELATLQQQHEDLQLDLMEKDEQQQLTQNRLQSILQLTSAQISNVG